MKRALFVAFMLTLETALCAGGAVLTWHMLEHGNTCERAPVMIVAGRAP